MECKTIEEVRENIDRIDRSIVALIAERGQYVEQASRFKTSSNGVKAPDRMEQVIGKVRQLAADCQGNPDIVEKVYRTMITEFINMEMQAFGESRREK